MNWTTILVGAVCGAVAALTVKLVMHRLGRDVATVRWLVFVVVFLVATFIAREYVVPRVEASQAESVLLKMPVFQVLKQYEPTAFAQALATIEANIANKGSDEEIASMSRPVIDAVLEKRLPTASAESVRQMVVVAVDELNQLYSRGDASCYAFLFPQVAGPPVLVGVIKKGSSGSRVGCLRG